MGHRNASVTPKPPTPLPPATAPRTTHDSHNESYPCTDRPCHGHPTWSRLPRRPPMRCSSHPAPASWRGRLPQQRCESSLQLSPSMVHLTGRPRQLTSTKHPRDRAHTAMNDEPLSTSASIKLDASPKTPEDIEPAGRWGCQLLQSSPCDIKTS